MFALKYVSFTNDDKPDLYKNTHIYFMLFQDYCIKY